MNAIPEDPSKAAFTSVPISQEAWEQIANKVAPLTDSISNASTPSSLSDRDWVDLTGTRSGVPSPIPSCPAEVLRECTPKEKGLIASMIVTLHEAGFLNWYTATTLLSEKGSQIKHLHPIQFMSFVLQEADLKGKLAEIFDSGAKKIGFMNGDGILSTTGFAHQLASANLEPHIPQFAASFNLSEELIMTHIGNKEWTELVTYLVKGT